MMEGSISASRLAMACDDVGLFAAQLRGNLCPDYRDGDILIISPARRAEAGDAVMFRATNGATCLLLVSADRQSFLDDKGKAVPEARQWKRLGTAVCVFRDRRPDARYDRPRGLK